MCAVGSWLRGRLVLLWAGTKAPKLRGTAIAKADAQSEDRDFIGYRQEGTRRQLAVYSTTQSIAMQPS
jgi:hypothetical protein